MKTHREMTEGIMRRVYGVYILRQLSQPVFRIGVLLALALALRELVWVSSIVENISHKANIVDFIQYGFLAFLGTEVAVQLVVLLGMFVVGYSMKDLFGIRGQQFA